eukprot:11090365-Alexandrium_andersonii.AAC.1
MPNRTSSSVRKCSGARVVSGVVRRHCSQVASSARTALGGAERTEVRGQGRQVHVRREVVVAGGAG